MLLITKCMHDCGQVMRYLVERAAPVDLSCLGTQGPRPIHWACRKGHTAVVQVLLQVINNIIILNFKLFVVEFFIKTPKNLINMKCWRGENRWFRKNIEIEKHISGSKETENKAKFWRKEKNSCHC